MTIAVIVQDWTMTFILFWKDICSRFEDCQPSGPLETTLEVLTIIGVVLSLIGIIATIVTLLLFKWVLYTYMQVLLCKLSMFHTNSPPWSQTSFSHLSINPQKASSARCNQVPPPTLHSSVLHADRFCDWHWQNRRVWRLCAGVSFDTLLHTGGRDVDGSRGFAHVPEAGHCVCPHHYQIHYCNFPCLLV